MRESGAKITHDPLPTLVGDEPQLTHLFQNLIDNAIKYRNELSPVIHIRADRQGSDWRFSVRDNGIGVPAQYKDRIFHMFQRLHGRDTYEGTGIGLATGRRIVDRHGGRIWVDPNADQGSTFSFTMPHRKMPDGETQNHDHREQPKTHRDLVGGGQPR